MLWLIAVPLWVVFWSFFLGDDFAYKINRKYYMVLCTLAVIFIMGLRSRYSGTTDTYHYTLWFEQAKSYLTLGDYFEYKEVFSGGVLFSEVGFHLYTWLCARILPGTQWFLLVTASLIATMTARFIAKNAKDPLISWITFICLGSMTFAMNGMRQALAMSICLLSYRFVREKKPLRFLLIVLLAVLFHKSALVFLLVYPMRRMRLNAMTFVVIAAGFALLVSFGDRLATLYNSMTGEDYEVGDVFETGGLVTVLIYLIAILCMFLLYQRLQDPERFLPFALIVVGFAIYLGRYTSQQIYERISYYFAYFLMLAFPEVMEGMEARTRTVTRISFLALAILLYVYRIRSGVFAEFTMFW